MGDILRQWSVENDCKLDAPHACWQCWSPIATLAVHGRWDSFLLRSNVRPSVSGFKDFLELHGRSYVKGAGNSFDVLDMTAGNNQEVSRDSFQSMAELFKQMFAVITGEADRPRAAAFDRFKAEILNGVMTLNHLADTLTVGMSSNLKD